MTNLIRRPNYELAASINKVEYLTEQEYLALIKASDNPEHRLLLRLLWETGLRISEALNLQFNNIYPDCIQLVGKGRKQRRVPAQTTLLGHLMRYRESHGDSKIFKKITTEPGALLMMRRLGVKAGMTKKIHPHLFRHSFAINFIKQGQDPFSLQEILGHSNMDMTKIYMRLAREAPQEAINNMAYPKIEEI